MSEILLLKAALHPQDDTRVICFFGTRKGDELSPVAQYDMDFDEMTPEWVAQTKARLQARVDHLKALVDSEIPRVIGVIGRVQ